MSTSPPGTRYPHYTRRVRSSFCHHIDTQWNGVTFRIRIYTIDNIRPGKLFNAMDNGTHEALPMHHAVQQLP